MCQVYYLVCDTVAIKVANLCTGLSRIMLGVRSKPKTELLQGQVAFIHPSGTTMPDAHNGLSHTFLSVAAKMSRLMLAGLLICLVR